MEEHFELQFAPGRSQELGPKSDPAHCSYACRKQGGSRTQSRINCVRHTGNSNVRRLEGGGRRKPSNQRIEKENEILLNKILSTYSTIPKAEDQSNQKYVNIVKTGRYAQRQQEGKRLAADNEKLVRRLTEIGMKDKLSGAKPSGKVATTALSKTVSSHKRLDASKESGAAGAEFVKTLPPEQAGQFRQTAQLNLTTHRVIHTAVRTASPAPIGTFKSINPPQGSATSNSKLSGSQRKSVSSSSSRQGKLQCGNPRLGAAPCGAITQSAKFRAPCVGHVIGTKGTKEVRGSGASRIGQDSKPSRTCRENPQCPPTVPQKTTRRAEEAHQTLLAHKSVSLKIQQGSTSLKPKSAKSNIGRSQERAPNLQSTLHRIHTRVGKELVTGKRKSLHDSQSRKVLSSQAAIKPKALEPFPASGRRQKVRESSTGPGASEHGREDHLGAPQPKPTSGPLLGVHSEPNVRYTEVANATAALDVKATISTQVAIANVSNSPGVIEVSSNMTPYNLFHNPAFKIGENIERIATSFERSTPLEKSHSELEAENSSACAEPSTQWKKDLLAENLPNASGKKMGTPYVALTTDATGSLPDTRTAAQREQDPDEADVVSRVILGGEQFYEEQVVNNDEGSADNSGREANLVNPQERCGDILHDSNAHNAPGVPTGGAAPIYSEPELTGLARNASEEPDGRDGMNEAQKTNHSQQTREVRDTDGPAEINEIDENRDALNQPENEKALLGSLHEELDECYTSEVQGVVNKLDFANRVDSETGVYGTFPSTTVYRDLESPADGVHECMGPPALSYQTSSMGVRSVAASVVQIARDAASPQMLLGHYPTSGEIVEKQDRISSCDHGVEKEPESEQKYATSRECHTVGEVQVEKPDDEEDGVARKGVSRASRQGNTAIKSESLKGAPQSVHVRHIIRNETQEVGSEHSTYRESECRENCDNQFVAMEFENEEGSPDHSGFHKLDASHEHSKAHKVARCTADLSTIGNLVAANPIFRKMASVTSLHECPLECANSLDTVNATNEGQPKQHTKNTQSCLPPSRLRGTLKGAVSSDEYVSFNQLPQTNQGDDTEQSDEMSRRSWSAGANFCGLDISKGQQEGKYFGEIQVSPQLEHTGTEQSFIQKENTLRSASSGRGNYDNSLKKMDGEKHVCLEERNTGGMGRIPSASERASDRKIKECDTCGTIEVQFDNVGNRDFRGVFEEIPHINFAGTSENMWSSIENSSASVDQQVLREPQQWGGGLRVPSRQFGGTPEWMGGQKEGGGEDEEDDERRKMSSIVKEGNGQNMGFYQAKVTSDRRNEKYAGTHHEGEQGELDVMREAGLSQEVKSGELKTDRRGSELIISQTCPDNSEGIAEGEGMTIEPVGAVEEVIQDKSLRFCDVLSEVSEGSNAEVRSVRSDGEAGQTTGSVGCKGECLSKIGSESAPPCQTSQCADGNVQIPSEKDVALKSETPCDFICRPLDRLIEFDYNLSDERVKDSVESERLRYNRAGGELDINGAQSHSELTQDEEEPNSDINFQGAPVQEENTSESSTLLGQILNVAGFRDDVVPCEGSQPETSRLGCKTSISDLNTIREVQQSVEKPLVADPRDETLDTLVHNPLEKPVEPSEEISDERVVNKALHKEKPTGKDDIIEKSAGGRAPHRSMLAASSSEVFAVLEIVNANKNTQENELPSDLEKTYSLDAPRNTSSRLETLEGGKPVKHIAETAGISEEGARDQGTNIGLSSASAESRNVKNILPIPAADRGRLLPGENGDVSVAANIRKNGVFEEKNECVEEASTLFGAEYCEGPENHGVGAESLRTIVIPERGIPGLPFRATVLPGDRAKKVDGGTDTTGKGVGKGSDNIVTENAGRTDAFAENDPPEGISSKNTLQDPIFPRDIPSKTGAQDLQAPSNPLMPLSLTSEELFIRDVHIDDGASSTSSDLLSAKEADGSEKAGLKAGAEVNTELASEANDELVDRKETNISRSDRPGDRDGSKGTTAVGGNSTVSIPNNLEKQGTLLELTQTRTLSNYLTDLMNSDQESQVGALDISPRGSSSSPNISEEESITVDQDISSSEELASNESISVAVSSQSSEKQNKSHRKHHKLEFAGSSLSDLSNLSDFMAELEEGMSEPHYEPNNNEIRQSTEVFP